MLLTMWTATTAAATTTTTRMNFTEKLSEHHQTIGQLWPHSLTTNGDLTSDKLQVTRAYPSYPLFTNTSIHKSQLEIQTRNYFSTSFLYTLIFFLAYIHTYPILPLLLQHWRHTFYPPRASHYKNLLAHPSISSISLSLSLSLLGGGIYPSRGLANVFRTMYGLHLRHSQSLLRSRNLQPNSSNIHSVAEPTQHVCTPMFETFTTLHQSGNNEKNSRRIERSLYTLLLSPTESFGWRLKMAHNKSLPSSW